MMLLFIVGITWRLLGQDFLQDRCVHLLSPNQPRGSTEGNNNNAIAVTYPFKWSLHIKQHTKTLAESLSDVTRSLSGQERCARHI